ncbi:MAG: DUF4301 family protein [Syntrophobacteraceae bacterium]
MKVDSMFNAADRKQMESLGIPESRVLSQIEIFRKSSYYVHLSRPCSLGEGVQKIPSFEAEKYLQLHHRASNTGRFQKFIPASGAATRMFQSLLQIYYLPQYLDPDELYRKAEQGVAIACDFLRFLDSLSKFAFFDDLEKVIAEDGWSLDDLICSVNYRAILDYLLTDQGLNYGALPKALLKFHRYQSECLTAFEEHLIDGACYLRNKTGQCNIHFTVSPDHEEGFKSLLDRVRTRYEERFSTRFNIRFSFQELSTKTIAVTMDNMPFREKSGRLHFRPGGHGALLGNLSKLCGDLVYIKNIDNVIPAHLKDKVLLWKRILGGYLVEVQELVHGTIRELMSNPSEERISDATKFARERLLLHLPESFESLPTDQKCATLLSKLNRPIRVCGVVPNSGEPGGAPFVVESKDGIFSLQIVEKAQVDFESAEQTGIWNSSTHFNPVDIVCALRDFEGKPFILKDHVDDDAVFISKKSKDGQDIKALELPGLWNGSMANWITVFIEAPTITFNPVKTLFDLLRPEHQSIQVVF